MMFFEIKLIKWFFKSLEESYLQFPWPQVPFEFAVKQVLEKLKNIAKGDYSTPDTEKRKFGAIVFAAVNLPATEIRTLLDNVCKWSAFSSIIFRILFTWDN